LLGLLSGNSLEFTEVGFTVLSLGDSLTGSAEDDVEVHTENTSVGIILDSKIDVFVNTESEVAYLIIWVRAFIIYK